MLGIEAAQGVEAVQGIEAAQGIEAVQGNGETGSDREDAGGTEEARWARTRPREVWTMGGIGSHQVLALALYARALGLRTSAAVFPQPVTPHTQEVLRAIVEQGCVLEPAANVLTVPVAGARLVARRAARSGGRPPVMIPPGSSNVYGTLGYVSAALELADQIRAGPAPRPAAIFTAYGSAGTAAGLMVGLRLAGLEIPVYPVRVVAAALGSAARLARLCRDTAGYLGARGVPVPGGFRARDMRILSGYVGGGYGHVTPEGREALQVAAEDGIRLETTYTAKAMAGLLDHVQGRGPGWRHVLLWNTFGARPVPLERSARWAQERLPRRLRYALD